MMRYFVLLLLTVSLNQLQAAVAIGKIWVAPHKVSAISMAPATSLQVKEQHEEEWEIWEEQIIGFEHEEGTSYLLLVQYTTEYKAEAKMVETQYSLVDILWKQNTEDSTKNLLHKTCWTLDKLSIMSSSAPSGFTLMKVEGLEMNMEISEREHRITGQSGCNRYFGPATFYEGKFTLTGEMGSTRMACDEYKMSMESTYLTLLSECNRYELKGKKLYLYKDQELKLAFSACKAKKKEKMGNR
jgi:heat shock protein HslJ